MARSVSVFEQSLGVPLFERKERGMLLTAAGEKVRLRAARIEAELNEVRDDAVRMLGGGTIGAIDALFHQPRLQAASLLAEVHHMPSVARATGMSHPAVRSTIARLEATLRRPLFMRPASGMVPTEAGARWVVRFERVLAELRHIEADIAALNGVLEGMVTVGALPVSVVPYCVAILGCRCVRWKARMKTCARIC